MSESAYHDAIMAVLSDKIDHKKILEQLCNDSNRISAYNRHVLEILRQRDPPVPFSCRLEPVSESTARLYREESYIEDVKRDIQLAKEFLGEFYQIENCPSFLYHEAMLEKEDLDFLLEIYSHAYGLKHNLSEDCGKYMQKSLVEYAKAIVRICKDSKSEQSFRDALQ